MVSGINNIEQSTFAQQVALQSFQRQVSTTDLKTESPLSFDDEDTAIISAQAKMLSELDKFNSGGDNAVDLAVSQVVAKNTVSAEVNVINTKKEMFDTLLDIGK